MLQEVLRLLSSPTEPSSHPRCGHRRQSAGAKRTGLSPCDPV